MNKQKLKYISCPPPLIRLCLSHRGALFFGHTGDGGVHLNSRMTGERIRYKLSQDIFKRYDGKRDNDPITCLARQTGRTVSSLVDQMSPKDLIKSFDKVNHLSE